MRTSRRPRGRGVDVWLDEQARAGCTASTLDQYAKTLTWAARRLGCDPADAGPDEWAAFAAAGVSFSRPRLRILRRYLTWAGRAIPAEIRDGTDGTPGRPGPPPKTRRINPAWHEPIADWLTWYATSSASPQTVALRRHQVHVMAEHFHPLGPFEVDPKRLAAYLTGRGWSRETMRSARGMVRSFYGWAHASGLNGSDPARLVRPIPARRGTPRPASDDDIGDALARATPRIYLALMLAARCGLRRVEIARLHTDDLQRSPSGWHVLNVTGKGSKERTVPVMDDIAAAIRERPRGWVFGNGQGGHLTPAHLGKLISEALPPGVTAHMLRHRFATTAYAASHDLRAVQELLGHSSPKVTQIYTSVNDQQLYSAAAAASRINVTSAPTPIWAAR